MIDQPVRIAHISDTHILATPGAELEGVDTFAALNSVVSSIRTSRWQPHLVIASGDISEDGTPASYRRAGDLMSTIGRLVYCVPGNHDSLQAMHSHLVSPLVRLDRTATIAGWRFVFLDSQVPGEGHGYLTRSELDALERALWMARELHVIVVLHHGPIDLCSNAPCRLENGDELLERLRGYGNVRAVLSGHMHCVAYERREPIDLMVAPSTCIQCDHVDGTHRLDVERRGYRRIDLYSDGRIESDVVWERSEVTG